LAQEGARLGSGNSVDDRIKELNSGGITTQSIVPSSSWSSSHNTGEAGPRGIMCLPSAWGLLPGWEQVKKVSLLTGCVG